MVIARSKPPTFPATGRARRFASYAAPINGGQYPADQNADGTWNIRGVPVFAEHERFGHAFDAAWIAAAVTRAAEQYHAGYVAPLHVGHHPSLRVERAGYFLLTGSDVRAFGASAEPVAVALADLLSVPAHVYARIRAGELPYCSVEVLRENFDDPEIKSLALLEHEAPYFPFPLITVGDEQPVAERLVASAPVVACYSAAGGAAAVFRFDGGPVKTKKKPLPAKPKAPAQANYMADEMEAHKAAAADALKAFTESLAKLAETVTKAAADLGIGGEEPAAEEAPAEEMQAAAEGPAEAPEEEEKKESMAASAGSRPMGAVIPLATYQAELAKMEARFNGRLAALERTQADAKKAREREAVVDSALKELAAYGAGDPARREELRTELLDYAAKGGAPAVAAYVAAAKTHGVEVPPESFGGDLAGQDEIDPPEVAAYSAKGAEALKEARASWRTWKKTSSQRPLEQYLAANVDPSSFVATSSSPKKKGK